jgi:hypothetical protein
LAIAKKKKTDKKFSLIESNIQSLQVPGHNQGYNAIAKVLILVCMVAKFGMYVPTCLVLLSIGR